MVLTPRRERWVAFAVLAAALALGLGVAAADTPVTHGTAGGAFLSHTEGGA